MYMTDLVFNVERTSNPTSPERLAEMARAIPVRRLGRVEEVAALAVLLASDEATYITGSEYNIDGGLLAGSAASPKSN